MSSPLGTSWEHRPSAPPAWTCSPSPSRTPRRWRLRADGCLTGTVQVTVTEDRGVAEIAWVVGTPWQGRGLASEAARELVTWLGRRSPTVRTVVAHIHPGHHASAAGLFPTEEEQDGEIRWRLSLPAAKRP
ncbi:GNAT family N-acetyltransferase [Streptomyces sp. GQFP]|uniref:GNAT family N-acetyltransferase n=1 Tax=Streptomyces sp. GQFP TaxID=2907545 RepID=UPI001F1AEAE2|nr:GNAT family N-acetyltransferase [Streptomyces sp. GQFP]UIX33905.1 GNAT family N-acetyltransferase [Streptomyces sp. GQFP]